jgi:hypothetical protein
MCDPPFTLPSLDGGLLGMRGHPSLCRDGLTYPDPEYGVVLYIMGGPPSVPVLDPSLVESIAVGGPCDLTAEGKVIRSPMFSAGIIGLAFPMSLELCIGEPLPDI